MFWHILGESTAVADAYSTVLRHTTQRKFFGALNRICVRWICSVWQIPSGNSQVFRTKTKCRTLSSTLFSRAATRLTSESKLRFALKPDSWIEILFSHDICCGGGGSAPACVYHIINGKLKISFCSNCDEYSQVECRSLWIWFIFVCARHDATYTNLQFEMNFEFG